MKEPQSVAYFSMEIALKPTMPTYSGGLGILAGDTLRAAADLGVPMIAMTLLHRGGYFTQHIDQAGWQHESPTSWRVEDFCRELPHRVEVAIEGRCVHLRCWQFDVTGCGGHVVPVLLLDANVTENSDWDRTLTDRLYGGDSHYRFCQEIILGMGGVRMLRAIGHDKITRFHMNEGHAALLGIELLDEQTKANQRETFNSDDVESVRRMCVFTTHTPVPAGHDRFPLDLVNGVLGRADILNHHEVFCCAGELNMTYLALNLSHYVNGVAKKHGEVSRKMLVPRDDVHHYQIDHITNGVHLQTWAAPSFAKLFDRYVPGWREDSASLRGVLAIPPSEIWDAHQTAKRRLMEAVKSRLDVSFDLETLTLGFARRATAYKRANLLVQDTMRLQRLAREMGRLQIVFAGKAHPRDQQGKDLIREIVQLRDTMVPEVQIVYLEDYDWELARTITAGVDVWLNTPQQPMEASGTSGMKAALNGVPSLSVLDGWWIEGCVEDVTGWAIGGLDPAEPSSQDRAQQDADALYDKLQNVVLAQYYQRPEAWLRIMSHAIALNASYFNTQRMVQQYVMKAYYG